MNTVKVRALRGCCIGSGRHLTAGQVAAVDPLVAAIVVGQQVAELVDDRDAPALRQALRDDVQRQQRGRSLGQQPGDPWRPLVH